MKTASCKAKGRRLQNWVREQILEHFPDLAPADVRSTSMGASGVDVLLSTKAQARFPYAVECKAVERLNIWSALEQAESHHGQGTPLLVITRNNADKYVVLSADFFFDRVS